MSDYWVKRFVEEEKRIYALSEKEIEKEVLEYERAIASINRDIETWYNRIAKNNDISLYEAKQLLNKKELRELKWSLEEYIEYAKKNGLGNKWTKELNNASSRIHIERLEALKLQTKAQIEKLYNEKHKSIEKHLKNIYEKEYKNSSKEILKSGIVGGKKTRFDEKLVDKVIKKPWAPDGKHFSDRIWNDKEKLLNVLHTELTQGFIRGDKLDTLINSISKKMNVSKTNVARLVHTESAAYSSRARCDSFKDLGVEKYEIVAALDSRTSDICRTMDNKVFDMKEYEIGVTAPPFHVRCRTTTAPYFEDLKEIEVEKSNKDGIMKERIRNLKSLTYEELKHINPEENVLKTKEYKKWKKSILTSEKNSLKLYTGNAYKKFNSYLRGNIEKINDSDIQDIKLLEGVLTRFETVKDYTLFRGSPNKFNIDNLSIGDEVVLDKAFLSTSFNIDIARSFTNGSETPVIFQIRLPKGKKVGAYIQEYSNYDYEEEFLMKPSTKFKILKFEIKEDEKLKKITHFYDLEVIE